MRDLQEICRTFLLLGWMAAYQEIESPSDDREWRLHSVIEVDDGVPRVVMTTIANVAGNIDQIGFKLASQY